jgi:uncharacterized protein YndB with AHSA1/START domain
MAAHKPKTKKTKTTKKAAAPKLVRRPAPRKNKPAPAKAARAAKRKPVAKAARKRKPAPAAAKAPRSRRGAVARSAAAGARPEHIPDGPTELDTIKLAYLFRDTSPAAIYRALMDAAEHSMFTGDKAEIEPHVGGRFQSYSGFIQGTTLELVPDARIVQSWRTKHFPKNNPDSTLELTFTPVPEGTRLEMRHLDVPKDQVEYLVTGWVTYYLDPLARHLGKRFSFRPPPL